MAQSNKPKVALPKTDCTGCGACAQLCNSEAITMKADAEGFLRPVVDNEKCVGCGLCAKRCPALNPTYRNEPKPACYALWAEDAIRDVSSSGGAFTLLAEHVFAQGGVVAGACFDPKFNVYHRVFDDVKYLHRLRGSKYVQSNTKRTFPEIEAVLKEGRPALYSGTPCQIAGLYAYLGKDYDNLLTVEIVCHGVPSHKAFRAYLKHLTGEGRNVKRVNFRSKRDFGWSSSSVVVFDDGRFYKCKAGDDPYFKAFLGNISTRPSCGTCKFATLPRQADLTIGDFWGISSYDRTLSDGRGTSLLLVNSPKGAAAFEAVRPRMPMCEQVPVEKAIKGNPTLKHPFRTNGAHKRFYQYLAKKPFDQLAIDCRQNRYDVGVVGLWYGLNYGSILTYYALYRVCNQLGYSALMLNKPDKLWSDVYLDPNSIANRFISARCQVSRLRKTDEEWRELNNHCHAFVVGSDVVWNNEICGDQAGDFFFLDFVKDTNKKISFASSFGRGYNPPYEVRQRQAALLQKFDGVSVRESDAVDICRDKLGVHADQVLDPVFLCRQSYYEQAAAQSKCKVDEPFIIGYILGPGPRKKRALEQVQAELGKRLMVVANPNSHDHCAERLAPLPVLDHPSVEDWLWYFQNTDLYVGDSFHGMCFALIFRRNFVIVMDRLLPSRCRFENLLRICGLEDKIFYIQDEPERLSELLTKTIDYDAVYARLEPLKKASLEWLADKLSSPKRDNHATVGDVAALEERVRVLEARLLALTGGDEIK